MRNRFVHYSASRKDSAHTHSSTGTHTHICTHNFAHTHMHIHARAHAHSDMRICRQKHTNTFLHSKHMNLVLGVVNVCSKVVVSELES